MAALSFVIAAPSAGQVGPALVPPAAAAEISVRAEPSAARGRQRRHIGLNLAASSLAAFGALRSRRGGGGRRLARGRPAATSERRGAAGRSRLVHSVSSYRGLPAARSAHRSSSDEAADIPWPTWFEPKPDASSSVSCMYQQSGIPKDFAVLCSSAVESAHQHVLTFRESALTAAFQWLDTWQDVEESLFWADALNGAFHPVKPARQVPLVVKAGKLPCDLAGTFMRVGPNPAHWPPKRRTHIFDGDGMVHTVRISGGEVLYNCAFLETERWKIEQRRNAEHFLRIGEFHGVCGLAKMLLAHLTDNRFTGVQAHEASTANTSVVLTPEGKLWALNESGAPFRFRLDDHGCPASVGFDTLGGTLRGQMSAHPKLDRRTGETFFHGFTYGVQSSFYVGRIVDGRVTDRVELPLSAGFHHDIFITERYVVVVDGSTDFHPQSIVTEEPLWMFGFERRLRFGLWPRSDRRMSAEDIIWIDAPEAAEIVHTLHAYDEGDRVVLWAPVSRGSPGNRDDVLGDVGPPRMHRIDIDVAAKSVDIRAVPGSHLRTEFPRVRDDAIGRRVDYGYSALQGDGSFGFNFIGIAKWNFQAGGLERTVHFPAGVVGGEPIFIPSSDSTGRDDDGYIGMFLWNTKTCESSFVVYDAHTLDLEPVVELQVPRRVPIGFHALWVSEEELQMQG